MAPGVVKNKRQKRETITPNKLCKRCRRSCKQPVNAVVASCPRYYPIHKKQQVIKEWKQPELFGDA